MPLRTDGPDMPAPAEALSKQRRYQVRHAAAGLCHYCPVSATHGRLCQYHADVAKARRQARRQAAGAKPKPNRCRRCGERGHNRATCRKPG